MHKRGSVLIDALIARGYRITRVRRHVAALLELEREPSTIKSLASRVPDADEASVYRTIELLEREGLIARVHGHHDIRYEIAGEHHHHVICTECGRTAHLPCSGTHGVVVPPRGFTQILRHEVTSYGRCAACS